jgi:hypothetical protein
MLNFGPELKLEQGTEPLRDTILPLTKAKRDAGA